MHAWYLHGKPSPKPCSTAHMQKLVHVYFEALHENETDMSNNPDQGVHYISDAPSRASQLPSLRHKLLAVLAMFAGGAGKGADQAMCRYAWLSAGHRRVVWCCRCLVD